MVMTYLGAQPGVILDEHGPVGILCDGGEPTGGGHLTLQVLVQQVLSCRFIDGFGCHDGMLWF